MTKRSQFSALSKFHAVVSTSIISALLIISFLLLPTTILPSSHLIFPKSYAQELSPGQSPTGNKPPSEQAPPVGQQQNRTITAAQNKTTTTASEQVPPQQVRTINETSARGVARATGQLPFNNSMLPKSSSSQTDLGTEQKNVNNWITANHDILGTRYSNQTTIGKDNVKNLHVKWILEAGSPIQNPPIIVGHKGYALTNAGEIIAFDTRTGQNLWNTKTGGTGFMHGMTYDNGVIFTGTAAKATVLAINASTGQKIWESPVLGPVKAGYGVVSPPILWHNYLIVGSAGGDLPPNEGLVQGNITALNRTNGDVLWNFKTTTGGWVGPGKVPPNGGATTWTGGALDPESGIIYMPAGNPTPDFNATTRANMPNNWSNHMLAVNVTNGKLVWATPFIVYGTSLKDVTIPDTHDWDLSWGASVNKVTYDNGTVRKVVIGGDKMGHVMAMDALTGKPLWSITLGTLYRTDIPPKPEGSGPVWPGAGQGAESYHAVDNNTLYVAVSSMGYNYFVKGSTGYIVPEFNAIKNGIGNGTITAIDIRTGKVKWEFPTPAPTYISPLVTNGLVFDGYMTDIGKPYPFNAFGNPVETILKPSSIFVALDKDTGKLLWQFNVGGPLGVGGASTGDGMIFVTTGSSSIRPSFTSGSIIAFGIG